MSYFDQLLRSLVPDGFVLELLISLVIQTCWLMPVAIVMAVFLRRASASGRHLLGNGERWIVGACRATSSADCRYQAARPATADFRTVTG